MRGAISGIGIGIGWTSEQGYAKSTYGAKTGREVKQIVTRSLHLNSISVFGSKMFSGVVRVDLGEGGGGVCVKESIGRGSPNGQPDHKTNLSLIAP